MFTRTRIWLVLLLMLVCVPILLHAQKEAPISIIRDDEIERSLRVFATSIFKASGLAADNVEIVIINDPTLNAFVSGGQRIYLHTGLIVESDDPLLVTGVMAHEAGHIAGGHLIRKRDEAEALGIESAISYVLGAASIAVGAPAAGQAIISGGTQVAQRGFLKYSRIYEESADQSGLQALEKAGLSARGLAKLLDKLNNEQALLHGNIDPYAQTHPPSVERLQHVKNFIQTSKVGDAPAPQAWQDQQRRNVAKLKGFIDPPERTLKNYPESDTSVAARYARAIAYYRQPDMKRALSEIDLLIKDYPNDPYFLELKGQMLFEHSKVEESIPYYRRAVQLQPDSALIRLGLGIAEIATEKKTYLEEAVMHLERVVLKEPKNAMAWRQLGIAYGRRNELGMSYMALAEEATLLGKKEDAKRFSKKAEELLPENSPGAIKIRDLKAALDKKKDDGLF
ncbi:MAG: M48 family peptidase [Proteobacteria bacterium]|nr:M48 family peptidase [Pseudomonadota bacterium]